MSKIMDVAEKEIIRQEILEMCQMAAPEGASEKVIRAALRKSGYDLAEEEVMRQIDYLEGKKLVTSQKVENRALGIKRVVIRITPDGTDYLEGNKTDIAGINEE